MYTTMAAKYGNTVNKILDTNAYYQNRERYIYIYI